MTRTRKILLATLAVGGLSFAGGAQAQYPAFPPYAGYSYPPPAATPPSWSYDPYTSGLADCPQWYPGLTSSCRELVPSYGQPNFRTRY